MIQIIGLFAISWILVWFFDRKNLSVLGLMPTKERLQYFTVLLVVSAIVSASAYLLRMLIAQETYGIAADLTSGSVLMETWYQIRTVLTEELMFRGVLLYMLIRKIGSRKAILLSSALFALMHLNAAILGDPIQMGLLLVFTFAMGLLLAYAYAKTFSLLVPFAIHFGWNYVQNYVFPGDSTGNHLLALAVPPPVVTISYLAFFTMLLLPKVSVILVDYFIVKRFKQAEMP